MKKFIYSVLFLWILWFANSSDDIYTLKSSILLDSFNIEWAMNTVSNLKQSVATIKDELYSLDDVEREAWLSDKYREVREQIVEVIQDINSTTDKVATMLKKLSTYKKQVLVAEKEVIDLQKDMDQIKKYIQIFTNFLYKLDNDLYNSDATDQIDEIKLLLTSENIAQTLSNDYLVRSVILQFNNLMDKLTQEEQEKTNLIQRLNKLKIVGIEQVRNYNVELENLKQKKNYLIDFIELYKSNSFRAEWWLSQLYNSITDINNTIRGFLADVRSKIFTNWIDIDSLLVDVVKIDSEYEDSHPFSWPAYPVSYIHRYFGDEVFEKQYWIHHDGIQIGVKQGSPVYSARNWVVYHVTDQDWIWINRVMILHSDWYATTYLYLNKSVVKVWDVVRKWQLIGYSGGEQGTRWAGFISKWANLTFGLYKNWRAIDPLKMLDLSVVQDKDLLQWNYEIKYLKDKYSRTIDITNLEFMTGDSNLERADTFLRLYGKWIYSELAFWEDVVDGTNVDRDIVICIAFAESTLGNYLTTSNNIWNVGNDDGWNRVSFSSALAWARAIANTLNNSYLGSYHTINQLSRYGNKDWSIYASSAQNRQKNVVTCASQIKGFYLPDDYPFRTWINPNKVSSNTGNLLD